MNDIDIIKAAECCFIIKDCSGCPLNRGDDDNSCIYDLRLSIFDLMKRQNAENERLKEVVERLQHHNRALCMLEKEQINRIKSEARKEFAEKVKEETYHYYDSDIDDLLKEMEKEND